MSETGAPPQLRLAEARELEEADFRRWYGPWEPIGPHAIGEFMAGFDRPWWIIGGWSIEAFTRVSREHDDLDISIRSEDVAAFCEFLGPAWTPWNAHSGWLRPYDPTRFPDVDPGSQLWIRRDSTSAWVLDVPFTPSVNGRWVNKRWPEHTAEIADVTWVAPDGLRYLDPEVTLMIKAKLDRAKDRADLAATWPLLDGARRGWLRDAVAAAHPGHAWLSSGPLADP